MKVLVTGFEPFEHEKINPSYEVVKALPDKWKKVEIIKKKVPVLYGKAVESVIEEIEKNNVSIVIMLGQAKGRASITVERVAVNVNDSKTPDNLKKILKGVPVIEGGAAGYFSTLPIYDIVKALKRVKIPAKISNSAGTFVCNSLFYGVMHEIYTTKHLNVLAGFVHVPYLPSQALKNPDIPSMSLDLMVKGVKKTIEVSVKKYQYQRDNKMLNPS